MTINGQTTTAKEFAFEGCHKIYLIESEDDRYEARDCGYDILPISSLREAFTSSCGLQFISNWQMSKRYVEQFEEACFE